ncbi:MAG: DUF6443 domain-containing protein, partial [Bacteroidota bacterium]
EEFSGLVYREMEYRNMLMPIRQRTFVDNVQLDGSWTQYNLFNNHPYPQYFRRYERTWDQLGLLLPGRWELQGTVFGYDRGNPTSVQMDGWNREYYTWTNSGLIDQRRYEDFTWDYEYHPGTNLVSSITDIDGQIVFHDYDVLGRLSESRARSGNVRTSYEYEYQNGSGRNYVKSRTDYTPVTGSNLQWMESWQYLDGLGRPMQTVQRQHSPDQKDVITAVEYDNQGRVSKEYVPYESAHDDGRFVAIPANQKHSSVQYEASPLNRTTSSTPPSWYATTSSYGTNGAGEVMNLQTNTFYAAKELLKTTVTDPNGNQTIGYKDKLGRDVMSNRTSGFASESAKTYFLYDDKSR